MKKSNELIEVIVEQLNLNREKESTEEYDRKWLTEEIESLIKEIKEQERSRLWAFISNYLKKLIWSEKDLEFLKRAWRHSEMSKEEIDAEQTNGKDYWN